MRKISRKQVEALLLTMPGPLGGGLNQMETGMVLRITRDAIAKRLGRFKKKHPVAWDNVMSIRHTASRQRENFEHSLRWDKNWMETLIVEKF